MIATADRATRLPHSRCEPAASTRCWSALWIALVAHRDHLDRAVRLHRLHLAQDQRGGDGDERLRAADRRSAWQNYSDAWARGHFDDHLRQQRDHHRDQGAARASLISAMAAYALARIHIRLGKAILLADPVRHDDPVPGACWRRCSRW